MSRTMRGAALALLLLAGGAMAQTPAPEPPPTPDPPYQQRLERLAELLGGLHHLRPLCAPAEGEAWRAAMAELIQGEQPPPLRRDRLVAAFNRGLAAFRETYRGCTDSARVAADLYRGEALALVRELATRFRN